MGQDELGRVILVTAEVEGSISHGRMRELTDAHPRDITLKFQELVRRGYLSSEGRTRGVTYSPAYSPKSSEQSSSSSEQSSEQSSSGSEQSPTDARRWTPQEEQIQALVAFCAREWRTLPEIAAALRRAESTVRTKYLPRLIAEGKIERRHPDRPRHPHQAYRTARPSETDEAK